MKKQIFPARIDALSDVIGCVECALELRGCPVKIQMAICVAVEEMFVNVALYAYGGKEGNVTLGIDFDQESRVITLCMSDKGIPFDPLKRPDPDITLSAKDRQIGGLGIFIAKKTMDKINYAYENGENVLTMVKKI